MQRWETHSRQLALQIHSSMQPCVQYPSMLPELAAPVLHEGKQ